MSVVAVVCLGVEAIMCVCVCVCVYCICVWVWYCVGGHACGCVGVHIRV